MLLGDQQIMIWKKKKKLLFKLYTTFDFWSQLVPIFVPRLKEPYIPVPSLCRVHNERLTRVAKKIKTF
jgi:hypothetical protein